MKFELSKNLRPSKTLTVLISGFVLAFAATGASAALVDNGTYTTDTVSGLDWLDLSATKGQSVATALSSNTGWSYANDVQVSGLLSSFGIAYGYTGGVYTLATTDAQANSFVQLFGETASGGAGASLGGYNNAAAGRSTYLCISSGRCGPKSFTYSLDLSGGDPVVGQFLVRAVPEPETFAMLLAGLGLIGAAVKRRKAKQP